jgi:erythromycin esterase-like protein
MASRNDIDRSSALRRARTQTADDLANTLPLFAEPLPELRHTEDFGARFDRFGEATLILLGEATHGTSEFYDARAAITRHLIEHHGFTIVAVEADWPDAARVDAYVRHLQPRPSREEVFTRFPQWMWRNAEFAAFSEWLRAHNRDLREQDRVSFRGLDIYSLRASIASVLEYLDRHDPAQAARARRRYGCLTPWQDDPARYGLQATIHAADKCEAEVVEQLQALLERRLTYLKEDGEDLFDATQNARVVRSAEQYYRAMYRGSAESWNLRDRHMFDTLQSLLKEAGRNKDRPDAAPPKAIVWAHNSHVGNAAATAMGWQGEFNIGELCRKAHGRNAVLIGFGTDRGTVAAASDWDGEMEVKAVRPARHDSYEYAFRKAGRPRSLFDWHAQGSELATALSFSLLERAIGVIYRPETELQSHYFESVLSEQFDAWVWLEETTAVTPLPVGHSAGMPDTYPFGM